MCHRKLQAENFGYPADNGRLKKEHRIALQSLRPEQNHDALLEAK